MLTFRAAGLHQHHQATTILWKSEARTTAQGRVCLAFATLRFRPLAACPYPKNEKDGKNQIFNFKLINQMDSFQQVPKSIYLSLLLSEGWQTLLKL